jgi:hypothetical protein
MPTLKPKKPRTITRSAAAKARNIRASKWASTLTSGGTPGQPVASTIARSSLRASGKNVTRRPVTRSEAAKLKNRITAQRKLPRITVVSTTAHRRAALERRKAASP